jgi:predicted Zn finger-like uncharacterized protein
MLVRCPKCRTTYKVSDDLLKGSSPAFRCSRCKHTFELEAHSSPDTGESSNAPGQDATAIPAGDQELPLPFETEEQPSEPDIHSQELAKGSPAMDDLPNELEPGDQWSLTGAEQKDEHHQFELPESDHRIKPDKIVDNPDEFPADDPFFPQPESGNKLDDLNNILAISSYREQKASVLPFFTLFGLLVIAFSFFSVISYAKPQTAEGIIKQIPVVGSAVLRNNYLKNGILVQSLRSSYQTIQGNREVLLISGVALNQNPEVVREIQLSGVAYNQDGKELERQTIWVGNTISPKIIRGMTLEDIPHLQNLKPLKSFEIPPGDSIPFTIVFLKSAKAAKEFSCEVLTAEGAT